ncbi:inositol polyphosphate 5-phosphatase K-like isoform X2 [Littorina saxatilis]|uniref:Inositol polyphosphate-related phosphatase domain-containing protein n=1 Tax=Littorina saxatilis TaxID=31220 RepID=A0AAN9FW05_9CAEN
MEPGETKSSAVPSTSGRTPSPANDGHLESSKLTEEPSTANIQPSTSRGQPPSSGQQMTTLQLDPNRPERLSASVDPPNPKEEENGIRTPSPANDGQLASSKLTEEPSTANIQPSTSRGQPPSSGQQESTLQPLVVDPNRQQRGSASVDRRKPTPCVKEEENGIRLYMLTWNVGGSKPPERLENLLSLTTFPVPDMYGIGLQEVNPRSSEVKEWIDTVSWLLATYDFVRVKYRQTQGIVTILFVKRHLLPYCNGFESEVTRTGFGGLWGNKGGVSIRLEVYGVNVIVINCHLAAHQKYVAERIIDYDSILDSQKFKDHDVDNILDHDYVFWMGDLNFRVDNMSRSEMDAAIAAKDYTQMLEHDQLNRCKEEKLIFEEFEEMDIDFAPTYKFDAGTHQYDTGPKKRLPAWCDRVLWHTYYTSYDDFQLKVVPLEYKSHPDYIISDHKPVSATFFFTVYKKPPHNPVQFERLKVWKKDEMHQVKYCVSRYAETSDSDWIGLYKKHFFSFDKFQSYTYAIDGAEKNRSGVVTTFSARALTVRPGEYCLCYMTSKFSLMGISNVFTIE